MGDLSNVTRFAYNNVKKKISLELRSRHIMDTLNQEHESKSTLSVMLTIFDI